MGDRPSYPNKTHRFFPNKADRLFRTRPIVFSDPNKTDRVFRTRPTIFSEQVWSPFPLFRTSLPNKTDRLIRIPNVLHPTRPNVFFRTTPIVFSADDHLSEQDRTSLHNKTERLYRTWPTVFCRTRPVVFSEPRQVLVTSVVVGTKHICTMIIVTAIRNIFYKNSPLVTVLYGLGPIKYNCTHNFTYWNFKLVSCG